MSTEDHQDPATSKGWQLLHAEALTSGHGRIVAEFFDVRHSRVLPWARRPEAAALVAALADPNRGFDAIVIGSSERAFYGQQFATMAPLFAHYGIPVWLPELDGEVDPEIVAHDELMVLLGIIAKREVVRARMRARTAMTIQARDQGHYLGGRPPYGYRSNRAWARRGVRLQRLDIDPTNGPVVTWMFQQRLAGHSTARVTRAPNDMKIPCPAAADRERNPPPHRRSVDARSPLHRPGPPGLTRGRLRATVIQASRQRRIEAETKRCLPGPGWRSTTVRVCGPPQRARCARRIRPRALSRDGR